MLNIQQRTPKLSRHVFLVAFCVLWLALGEVLPVQASTPRSGAFALAGLPAQLIIPSLGINAPIEAAGQDASGAMVAPASDDEVAWYNLGPQPGERGNAVIAGHLDDVHGRPAIFWHIDELNAGDEIIVRFDNGRQRRFAVMSVESYAADAAPMERIFGLDFDHDLNLITCDGIWNAKSKLYSKRLVVYARLIHESNDSPKSNASSPLTAPPSPGPTHARQDGNQPSTTS